MQGHGCIIAPDFCVAHREANSGLSTLNRTKSILSIYHQQRQLQKQRGMCLNDTYPFCQQPLSGNCHSICFSKPVLWTATSWPAFFVAPVSAGRSPGTRRGLAPCRTPGMQRRLRLSGPHFSLLVQRKVAAGAVEKKHGLYPLAVPKGRPGVSSDVSDQTRESSTGCVEH